jgi:hypothetical protein
MWVKLKRKSVLENPVQPLKINFDYRKNKLTFRAKIHVNDIFLFFKNYF